MLGYLNRYNNFEIPGFGALLRDKDTLFLPRYENFTNELALTCIVVGLIFIAFGKQNNEDELTAKMRLNALYWAILINYTWYGVFIVLACFNAVILVPGITVLVELAGENLAFMVYNLFTPLVIVLIRFYYLLYKSRDEYQIKPIKFLPNKPYRIVGKILTLMMSIATILAQAFLDNENIGSMLFCLLPLIMLLWIYSNEREEDEYINSVRMDAMQIAVYVNYAILLAANMFVYGVSFYLVLLLNLVTIPVIFLATFNYRLYKIRQQQSSAGNTNITLGIL